MIRFTASTRAPTALALALVGAAGLAQAAPFKAVLLLPADDPRLERSRVERAYLGHPTGAVTDGLAAAIKE
ncbi:MAG: branched-chain amino acid ABC transporter substrate-binding protein, partial [Leptothrix sp. (in: Bacteria)]|nr:branched-chain amino acid ABC transporter substrate-binding protein [Leptothrix sp. (in: b-proteobacteria)]